VFWALKTRAAGRRGFGNPFCHRVRRALVGNGETLPVGVQRGGEPLRGAASSGGTLMQKVGNPQ
jgi:hypothetical protein